MLFFLGQSSIMRKVVENNFNKRISEVEEFTMVKWTTLFSGMAIATLLLTGCGTATNDVVKDNTKYK